MTVDTFPSNQMRSVQFNQALYVAAAFQSRSSSPNSRTNNSCRYDSIILPLWIREKGHVAVSHAGDRRSDEVKKADSCVSDEEQQLMTGHLQKLEKNRHQPVFWTQDSDVPILEIHSLFANGTAHSFSSCSLAGQKVANSDPILTVTFVRLLVRGPPRPLVRHRLSTGRMYNPSAASQVSFQTAVRNLLYGNGSHHYKVDNHPPIFPSQNLAIAIIFRMKRPKNHFVANRPGHGRLRQNAPPQISITRSDVDNLAKFVLDSLNGLMYDDDRQVCSLHTVKFLDNEDRCEGATEICVRVIDDASLDKLVNNSLARF